MKSFFSIISVSPNTNSMDAIAIGLLLHNGEKYEFGLSKRKLGLAKHFGEVNTAFLTKVLANMELFYSQPTNAFSNFSLFGSKPSTDVLDQFNYLHNYSNGLIKFSEPKALLSVNKSTFQELNALFIDSKLIEKN